MGLIFTFHFLKFNGTRAWGEFPPCLEAAVLPHCEGLPNVARTSQSLPGLDVEKTRTVRLKPQKSWEPSGEKQSEWAAVNSS